MKPVPSIRLFIFLAFGASGAAALVYEIVWTRMLSTIMGSSTYALSTMLAAFMAGLSAGGWMGSKARYTGAQAAMAFALCELGIGVTAILTMPAIRALSPVYISSFYAFDLSFTAFSWFQLIVVFMIMGIPTTLMGMTFPLVIRYFATEGSDVGRQVGRLYAVNTLGAIGGATSAGFLLLPNIGARWSALTAAGVNVAIGAVILAYFWSRRG